MQVKLSLDRVLTIILVLAIVSVIGAFAYTVTNPKEENFTEFYILGTGEKAEGYPKELTVGEEGRVTLNIINREHQTMVYQVGIIVGGVLDEEIGPIELARQEQWAQQVGFAPQEACAVTTLVEKVYYPYGPYLATQTSIKVESVEHLSPGDHIWIGEEAAQIQAIDDHIITLNEALQDYHASGSRVIELQKVEFVLYKTRMLGSDAERTRLFLSLGEEDLSARVINRGQSEASYNIEVVVVVSHEQMARVKSTGSVILAPEEEWEQEMEIPVVEAWPQKVMFSLIRDGRLLYKEMASVRYPGIYLWIDVKESNAAN